MKNCPKKLSTLGVAIGLLAFSGSAVHAQTVLADFDTVVPTKRDYGNNTVNRFTNGTPDTENLEFTLGDFFTSIAPLDNGDIVAGAFDSSNGVSLNSGAGNTRFVGFAFDFSSLEESTVTFSWDAIETRAGNDALISIYSFTAATDTPAIRNGVAGATSTIDITLNGATELVASTTFDVTTSGGTFSQEFSWDGSDDSLLVVFGGQGNRDYIFDNLSYTAVAIPEPSTYAALLGLGVIALVAIRRRKN